jgi:hypothetical protein
MDNARAFVGAVRARQAQCRHQPRRRAMMDEAWSRGWAEAHKAALQAREAMAREGRPLPSLWDELRMLVCDLITPPHRPQADEACCNEATCQSAA